MGPRVGQSKSWDIRGTSVWKVSPWADGRVRVLVWNTELHLQRHIALLYILVLFLAVVIYLLLSPFSTWFCRPTKLLGAVMI